MSILPLCAALLIAAPATRPDPAEDVARLAGEVLRDPAASAAWVELAGAVAALEAAEPDAAPRQDGAAVVVTRGRAAAASLLEAWTATVAAADSRLLRMIAALALAVLVALGIRRAAARPRRSEAAASAAASAAATGPWAVRTLARSGLPAPEIARRTGIAQDAVRLLAGR